jgi:hypothetical protein
MTATLLERSTSTRRTLADFIAEAGEAAETARARAQVARLLTLPVEAEAYERDARRHDEAIAALQSFLAALAH